MNHKEYNKAQEMLDLLPERNTMDKRKLQADLLAKQGKLTEAAKILEQRLLIKISEIQTVLISLADIALREDNTQNAYGLAEIARKSAKLFDLWDYNTFVAPLQIAIAQENVPDSISLLKSIFSATLTPWDIKSSFLYRHIAVKDNKENYGVQFLRVLLSEVEGSPKYAFLHSNTEYQQMIKQYRAKC